MPAREDFVAGLNDQFVALIVEPVTIVIGDSGGFLQCHVGRDHLTRNQIFSDAEMFQGTLGLSAPQLVLRNFNHTQAVGLFSHVGHVNSPRVKIMPRGWLGTDMSSCNWIDRGQRLFERLSHEIVSRLYARSGAEAARVRSDCDGTKESLAPGLSTTYARRHG